MTQVAQLPPDLQAALNGRDVIVFDGVCVLCSGFFRFMLKHDKTERFSFALAQSDIGTRLYSALDMPTDDFESNLVIVDGQIYQRGHAFARAMGALGWPWKALSLLRFVPRIISDPFYHLIARNRYRFFGRYDTCLFPNDALKSRFLPDGWSAQTA